ncbi:hypothetical protein BDZ45DRAFT_748354 [Acephala macrosclerotiorum]|nr:hypothetical protein BDZ45DRAFT_748354 [Acephala macrosclerotiorum]
MAALNLLRGTAKNCHLLKVLEKSTPGNCGKRRGLALMPKPPSIDQIIDVFRQTTDGLENAHKLIQDHAIYEVAQVFFRDQNALSNISLGLIKGMRTYAPGRPLKTILKDSVLSRQLENDVDIIYGPTAENDFQKVLECLKRHPGFSQLPNSELFAIFRRVIRELYLKRNSLRKPTSICYNAPFENDPKHPITTMGLDKYIDSVIKRTKKSRDEVLKNFGRPIVEHDRKRKRNREETQAYQFEDEFELEVINLLAQWFYTEIDFGRIKLYTDEDPRRANLIESECLVKLWILAGKLLMPILQNMTMASFTTACSTRRRVPSETTRRSGAPTTTIF